jgi:ornithine cyclodeaminase
MRLRVLTAHDLDGLVTMKQASDAMKCAFAALSAGRAAAPARIHVDAHEAGGKTLLMGALVPGTGLASKVVSYFPNNRDRGLPTIHGIVIVLDETTGVPMALCDGTSLTAFRTGAGTCASIELLARADAKIGALFGTGGQAAQQLRAMDAARNLSTIRVVSRSRQRGEAFVLAERPRTKAKLELTDADTAIGEADVVVASTNASVPVFDGRRLPSGCHVTAIGSITAQMEEVDETTISRCRIFVDSVAGVSTEAGELIQGVARKLTSPDRWTELGDVVLGKSPGRRNDEELTLFKSVGHAVQDVAIARLCLDRASELGVGRDVEL